MSKTKRGPLSTGGYECTFVDDPPDELICQICSLVAQQPQQVSCCGHIFCKTCLDKYKKHCDHSKFCCPNCKKGGFSFHDKRGSRNIKCLKVKCIHMECGCTWEGELFYLQEHLGECPFTKVSCPNRCSAAIRRADLKTHTEKHCPLRRYWCPNCNFRETYQFVVTKHQEECPEAIVPCPSGCGYTSIIRRLLFSHKSVCPNEIIPCTYARVGCEERICRKDMPQHKAHAVDHHLELAMKAIENQKRPLAVFKMNDFSYCKSNNKWWYSPGFYTHRGGYKLCLGIAANGNGDGRNTHISVYIYRMKGENDGNLIWPFRGSVTFELLNQLQDEEHFTRTVPFDFYVSNEFNSRVLKGDRSRQGWGFNRFISQEALGLRNMALYLKDDCLFFRISGTEVYPTNKPWLICTT